MRLCDIVDELELEVCTENCDLSGEVSGCYISDLMSDVMANAAERNLWLTIHIHPNIAAVAQFKALAGVVVVNGRDPQAETILNADKHGIPLMTTQLSSYEIAGRLYQMGCGTRRDDATSR